MSRENDDICTVCYGKGNLLLCDECPRSYHFDCLQTEIDENVSHFACADGTGNECTLRTEPILVERRYDDEEDGLQRAAKAKFSGKIATKDTKARKEEYRRLQMDGVVYKIGDCCELMGEDEGNNLWMGRISKFYQLRGEAESSKFVEVKWFYIPEQTKCGRTDVMLQKEVFTSVYGDNYTVDNITRKCWMFHLHQYAEAVQDPELTSLENFDKKWCFWYRKAYMVDCCEFRPSHDIWTFDAKTDSYTELKHLSRTEKRKHDHFDECDMPAEDPEDDDGGMMAMASQVPQAVRVQQRGKRAQRKAKVSKGDGVDKAEGALNVFDQATAKLALSAVPERMPCREQEHRQIYSFLSNVIRQAGLSSGLYISGMPGTGKTATCRQVVRELHDLSQQDDGDFPGFIFIEINALKLAHPSDAYSVLYEELTDERVGPATAVKKLDKLFGRPSDRPMCVVLLDELDYMVTPKQDVLYNFFDWPGRRNSRFCVIGIANTMDLPERLMPRVQSRLGSQRCVFVAYSRFDIEKIIHARLKGLKVFDASAVEYCARKVSAISGDVRRALAICRRAAERFQAEQKDKPGAASIIMMKHIQEASKEMYASNEIALVQNCTLFEKLFLAYLAQLGRRGTGIILGTVLSRIQAFCRSKGKTALGIHHLEQVCIKLGDAGLISHQTNRLRGEWGVALCMQSDDLNWAFKDDPDLLSIVQT